MRIKCFSHNICLFLWIFTKGNVSPLMFSRWIRGTAILFWGSRWNTANTMTAPEYMESTTTLHNSWQSSILDHYHKDVVEKYVNPPIPEKKIFVASVSPFFPFISSISLNSRCIIHTNISVLTIFLHPDTDAIYIYIYIYKINLNRESEIFY